jgi:hypothetical protein
MVVWIVEIVGITERFRSVKIVGLVSMFGLCS